MNAASIASMASGSLAGSGTRGRWVTGLSSIGAGAGLSGRASEHPSSPMIRLPTYPPIARNAVDGRCQVV